MKILARFLCFLFVGPYIIIFGLLVATLGITELTLTNKNASLDWIDKQKDRFVKYAFNY